VVYVAARPPRSVFRSIANHLGRKIVYVPLGQLAPAKLKKIRVVHVLDGYQRRETAKDYIW
jgi:Mor family transcriptional regulator